MVRFRWSPEKHAANLLGKSSGGQLLVVAHAEGGDEIRIISARRATKRERAMYEEG
jgi:hypothetical protein